jgi:hypothetical protein
MSFSAEKLNYFLQQSRLRLLLRSTIDVKVDIDTLCGGVHPRGIKIIIGGFIPSTDASVFVLLHQ